ncbi:META domain-containing protein [Cyanobium sp. LEGE 06143]|uniref:META domain-containing protein n=1 Tax=Cyanobium sp. LEGE 06143 TaxID=945727 RepID=UPI00187E0440|nr:META domain-containing protein [Cyanobium sp. LEGE 06143]
MVLSLLALLMLTVFAGRAATAREDQPVLADSTWRLVEIRSMDGNQGVRRPATPSRYSLRLEADGSAQLRLDCNRAQGAWSISPGTDPSIGGFRFGPLATTKALCPQPSLGEALGAQLPAVRGYALQGGLLSLRLKEDRQPSALRAPA